MVVVGQALINIRSCQSARPTCQTVTINCELHHMHNSQCNSHSFPLGCAFGLLASATAWTVHPKLLCHLPTLKFSYTSTTAKFVVCLSTRLLPHWGWGCYEQPLQDHHRCYWCLLDCITQQYYHGLTSIYYPYCNFIGTF